ncbi:hypothetical protein IAR55_007210 [Kwoniella newhampshirensis]|uniref:Uncharacterized protein n=1 Tax=Kwoniella newhampshirensis TaxID=1651941 RepID=A0AAW0YCR9_9TREE
MNGSKASSCVRHSETSNKAYILPPPPGFALPERGIPLTPRRSIPGQTQSFHARPLISTPATRTAASTGERYDVGTPARSLLRRYNVMSGAWTKDLGKQVAEVSNKYGVAINAEDIRAHPLHLPAPRQVMADLIVQRGHRHPADGYEEDGEAHRIATSSGRRMQYRHRQEREISAEHRSGRSGSEGWSDGGMVGVETAASEPAEEHISEQEAQSELASKLAPTTRQARSGLMTTKISLVGTSAFLDDSLLNGDEGISVEELRHGSPDLDRESAIPMAAIRTTDNNVLSRPNSDCPKRRASTTMIRMSNTPRPGKRHRVGPSPYQRQPDERGSGEGPEDGSSAPSGSASDPDFDLTQELIDSPQEEDDDDDDDDDEYQVQDQSEEDEDDNEEQTLVGSRRGSEPNSTAQPRTTKSLLYRSTISRLQVNGSRQQHTTRGRGGGRNTGRNSANPSTIRSNKNKDRRDQEWMCATDFLAGTHDSLLNLASELIENGIDHRQNQDKDESTLDNLEDQLLAIAQDQDEDEQARIVGPLIDFVLQLCKETGDHIGFIRSAQGRMGRSSAAKRIDLTKKFKRDYEGKEFEG